MKYELVIFDLDGTILDTLYDLWASMAYALDAFSLPGRSMEEVRSFVGNGIRRLVERSVPKDTPEDTVEGVYNCFMEHYAAHYADHTLPYNGIPELVDELKAAGLKLAVASNKKDFAVKKLCSLFFPDKFDDTVGEREGVGKKPAPDCVLELLGSLNVPREQAVYIGDSGVDIETAKNAGIECISVCWGFRTKAQLEECGAACSVESPAKIAALLLG